MYLLRLAAIFYSPKVKVHIQHGAEFMQHCAGHFDVIITDSSDLIDEEIEALQVIPRLLGSLGAWVKD